ncbi:hypothetical protein ACTXT7_005994 [Hymenolepis weldensis]
MPYTGLSQRIERYFTRFYKTMMPIINDRHPDWPIRKRETEIRYLWGLCERQVRCRLSAVNDETNYESQLVRYVREFLHRRPEEQYFFLCLYGGVSCDGSDGNSGMESD